MLNKDLFFSEVRETRDEYLTRAAKVLDDINRGNIQMEADDVQQFKNIIGEVMMPDIIDAVDYCKRIGMINDIEDDFMQILSLKMFSKLPDFNNSKNTEYGEVFKFSTFVHLYVDDAVRTARAKDRGYALRVDRKKRKIAKTVKLASEKLNKHAEDISVEEIFLFMPEVTKNPMSIKEIERTVNSINAVYSLDANDRDEYEEKGLEDVILIEEDSIKLEFKRFINQFRPLQKFLFLQGIGYCSEQYDEIHTKQLACDPKFVAFCREDRVGVNHIRRGDFKIDRVKINNKYFDSVEYENILYVEERYIRDEKGRMNNRFRRMISEGDYSEQEVLANLVPVLNEIKEEILREYGL